MPKRKLIEPNLLTSIELAAYLGVSRWTLILWLKQGKIPEPSLMRGNKRLWSREQAEEIKRRIAV